MGEEREGTENQCHLVDCERACERASVQSTWRETPFPQNRMSASIENFNKASCLSAAAPSKSEIAGPEPRSPRDHA